MDPKESPPNEGVASDIDASRVILLLLDGKPEGTAIEELLFAELPCSNELVPLGANADRPLPYPPKLEERFGLDDPLKPEPALCLVLNPENAPKEVWPKAGEACDGT